MPTILRSPLVTTSAPIAVFGQELIASDSFSFGPSVKTSWPLASRIALTVMASSFCLAFV